MDSELKKFEVSADRGFLPASDPLDLLPREFAAWQEIGRELPKLLLSDRVRAVMDELPILDARKLQDDAQLRRAMLLLSYFGHAYVWGSAKPADRLPRGVAIPWYVISQKLGRPPVLSYASYALDNWRRMDPRGPIALGNISLLQNFLGGADEEWFILVHVDIEAKAAAAIRALLPAQDAVAADDAKLLESHLRTVEQSLASMNATMLRMPERCDPYIYFNRVRPYIFGWKDQPALPSGLIYEGVEAYNGQPQKFRGETGAQSSIVPSLDAALGVTHKSDPLRVYLQEMRDYMPPKHRAFIDALAAGPSIRKYVMDHASVRDVYNECLVWIEEFRSKHLEYAASYIHRQSQKSRSNPTEVGTGGTPFMPYLKKHVIETGKHQIG